MTKSAAKIKKSRIEESYNETPYESYPYYNSSPEKLATLGTLFGMTPPDIENAKVLELGCASGGNLIPHAIKYPKGKFVGVDLSENQIKEGQEHIKNLGLKNIELKYMSITDIDKKFGEFDYIICHGVFSWVPTEVQNKIFEVAKNNLSKNGITYISYNTLPGWNMVRTVRDMMQYHSKGFTNSKDKVSQSRALLSFVKDALDGQDSAYAKMMSQEAEMLTKQADPYIAHEHLAEYNTQSYFSDFMQQAQSHKMQYLSDVAINTMYLGNMPEKVQEKLNALNDIVQTEQYMDFINNRRFRSTLLCHQGVKINRALNSDTIKKFALSLPIKPEKPIDKANLEKNPSMKFLIRGKKDSSISSHSPYLTAVLCVLSENTGFPLNYETIIKKANDLFEKDCSKQIEQDFLKNAMNLVMKGIMEITLKEQSKNSISLDKPKALPLVQYQIKHNKNNWVTSYNHSPVAINLFDKLALSYMNGQNNLNQISELLSSDIKDGKLSMNKDNKKVEDPKEMKTELLNALKQSIAKYATNGILYN
ncbi:MAG: hypothetical protein DGJ47_000914 [Rickettsiaceae bacterium]